MSGSFITSCARPLPPSLSFFFFLSKGPHVFLVLPVLEAGVHKVLDHHEHPHIPHVQCEHLKPLLFLVYIIVTKTMCLHCLRLALLTQLSKYHNFL